MSNNEIIADKIVEDLFSNGYGQQAKRLVLELEDERDGGGWGRNVVRDRILDILNSVPVSDVSVTDKFTITPFKIQLNQI